MEDIDLYGSQCNDTPIRPCGYKILVEIPKPPETKAGGLIHVPVSTQTKEQNQSVVAKVLQLGAYCYQDESRYPKELGPWCKPGDFIAMSPYNGTNISLPGSDRVFRFINEDAVDGIVPDPNAIERR